MKSMVEETIERAERAVVQGVIPVDLVCKLITYLRHADTSAHERWQRMQQLERTVISLGGGIDRHGYQEPRGLMVQHGTHTVVEDSR